MRNNTVTSDNKNHFSHINMHSIPGGMIITGEKYPYPYQYISPEAAALFGYTVEEIQEVTRGYAVNLVCEDDRARVFETVKQELENDSYSVKYRVRCKDGSIKYIMDCGKRTVDREEKTCLISLYLDVTKEQENEYLLNLQNELLTKETLLAKQCEANSRKEALIHALCRDYNTAFYADLDTDTFKVFRMDKDLPEGVKSIFQSQNSFSRFMDRYVHVVVHPADRDEMLQRFSIQNLWTQLQEKTSFIHTYRIKRDGKTVYFEVKCARINIHPCSAKLMFGFHSIDGQIRAEMEKNQLLADALEQAQCASRAKTSFLNNMSHDIRTPMNAIIGFTTLARAHMNNPARVADYLGKIEQSSKHLLSLINDVLDMSRIESGKMSLDEKPENLFEIIQNLRDIVWSDIQARKLTLNIETDKITDGEVCCDRLRLNQVLLNLLSNAMKFTREGGTVSILVSQSASTKLGCATYEFRVRDTGIGMSKDFAEHIFEPFTRESTSTVSGIQGTGLGMSITKSFVDMMGGTITVNSEPGKGTEFVVTLGFLLAEEPDAAATADSSPEPTETLAGLRILLAEDNELNTEIAVELLTEAGCTIETAENGKIAADMVLNHAPGHYDLVLMDIQMPVMDGYEATRTIRSSQNPQLASIPIIAMTANAFEEDRKQALAAGMDAHIAKPVDINKLLSTIRTVIKENRDTISV